MTKSPLRVQTSIDAFFVRKPKKPKAEPKPPKTSGQSSIRDFFGPAPAVSTNTSTIVADVPEPPSVHSNPIPTCMHDVGCQEKPQPMHATVPHHDPVATQALNAAQCKCSHEQEAEPPTFVSNRPQPQALPAPRRAARPAWRIHLSNLFDELATVAHPNTGPVMQVEVWYVHHDAYPECVEPGIVELDNIQDLWYADLCNVWLDRVQRHQPMRVLNVLPNPPYHTHPRTAVHIILEQGLHPQKVAIHFTTIFLGGSRVGLFQRAESAPDRICTQDMIDRHGFQLQCDYRQCNMHSGLLRFSMHDPEEIFSGISAVLSVAPPPQEPEAVSRANRLEAQAPNPTHEHDVDSDDAALMQVSPPSHQAPDPASSGVEYPGIGFNHRITPAALAEFRQTLEWQARELGHQCGTSARVPIQVRSWYLHSDRRIRTEESRTVLLDAKPHTWHHTIIDKWRELLEPDQPVHLHVVLPNPPGASLEPELHVILLQRPNPLWRSAILTVSYPHVDVWSLQFFAVMLDVNTDHEQLGFISGVTHPSNPQARELDVEVTHGQVTLAREGTFPVRHGFWFDVRAVRRESLADDSHALIQTQFQSIRASIRNIQSRIHSAAFACMTTGDENRGSEMAPRAMSVAVMPNEPQTFIDPCSALAFFTALQALWQPLAILQPPTMPALVPVVTWYNDHIRFPQCFQPRLVLLNHDPNDWVQRIRSVWIDVVSPQHAMHVHLVRPAPPDMPTHLAAHIVVVQQPIATFRSVLITSFDSDAAQGQSNRHATMAPTPVAFPTVLALAYHDTVCQQPQNESAVWVGNDELSPTEQLPLIDGHSVVLALHRHHMPLPEGPHAWNSEAYAPGSLFRSPDALPPEVNDPLLKCTKQDTIMQTQPVSVPCPGHPVVLSLDAVLPVTRADPAQPWQDDLSALAWNASSNWLQQITDSLDLQLSPVPAQIACTPSTWNAIFEALEAPIGPYELIEVFVDGATSAVAASWSLVLVAHHGTSQRLLGTLAGPVITGTAHQHWLGASTLDNIAAELSALAAALATVLQFQFNCPVLVHPDLSLSRLIAQELVNTVSNPRLAQLCRLLAAWSPPNVNFQEVRGHTKHAWNDLADSLAKHVLLAPDQFPPIDFGALHQLAREQHDLEWAWVQSLPQSMRHCFPNAVQDTVWQFAPSQRQVELPMPSRAQERIPVDFRCRIATINVLALDRTDSQTEIGRRTGARTTRLDHQLHTAGIHIAGLQETRTAQGQYRAEHYLILSSGGAGQNAERSGCELWLHRTLPLLTTTAQGKVTLADCTCVVAHADPRRLFVRIEHDALCLTAVVLHAPCLGKATGDATAPIDVIKQWWTQTTAIWQQAVATDMTCVLIDANATLASTTTDFFQQHDADATTPQSLIFEDFLCEQAMFVPSTFKAIHRGPSYTWTHSSGKRMRLDYILLSRALFEMVSQSETWTSYDGTFAHEDHIPAVLTLNGWIHTHQAAPPHSWDEFALMDPTRCRQFQDALATLPIPPWEVATDAHSTLYEAQYKQLARQFFSKKQGARRRPTLSAPTLDAIAFKRHVLDCGRAWAIMTDPDFKEQLKLIERTVRRLVSADLQVFFDQLLVHLQEAGQLADHKQMFRILARLGSRKQKARMQSKPLPMLRTPQGEMVTSYAQQQLLWLHQFAHIEAGIRVSWETLRTSDASMPMLPRDIQEVETFPSDWNLQAAVARMKRGKAPGPNGITPCLLKAGGSIFSKQFTALTTKVVAHGKEPSSWKGGKLVPLYKGRDSTADPAAYRAIYIPTTHPSSTTGCCAVSWKGHGQRAWTYCRLEAGRPWAQISPTTWWKPTSSGVGGVNCHQQWSSLI